MCFTDNRRRSLGSERCLAFIVSKGTVCNRNLIPFESIMDMRKVMSSSDNTKTQMIQFESIVEKLK
jgi:hypothetical protein